MNYKLLNEMMDYIENHLTDDIKYKDLAKIVGINDFILQRVFTFVAGISISEYIRKRRLSKAYEDLKLTNDKIIDISIKYGYDSSKSFSRAFKKEFDVLPSKVKKDPLKVYKIYPKINFESEYQKNKVISYEVKNIKGFTVYGIKVSAENAEDLRYKIRELYKKVKANGMYEWFNNYERYAISYFTNEKEKVYILGSKYKDETLESFIVRDGLYAIFEVENLNQADIKNTKGFINNIWKYSSGLNISNEPLIESYDNNKCFIWVPLYR